MALAVSVSIEGTEGELADAGLDREFSKEIHFMWPRAGRRPLFGIGRLASISEDIPARYAMDPWARERRVTITLQAVLGRRPWSR